MIKGYKRYCDRCGVELTKRNNVCGFELCDKCNEVLGQQLAIKNDLAHNLCDSCTNIGCEFQSGIVRTKCAFYMPPQLEPDNCGNYVVQDSTTKNNLGVDTISRDAVLKPYEGLKDDDTIAVWLIRKNIEQQPSVKQEPKTGHWIYIRNSEVNGLKIVKCSECGKRTYGSGNYCPNCGAKMESEG